MPSSSIVQVQDDATLVVKDQTTSNPEVEITTVAATTTITQIINSLPSTQVAVAFPSVVLETINDQVLVTNALNNSAVVSDTIPAPIAVVEQDEQAQVVLVNTGSPGLPGPQGPQGIPGTQGVQNVFIQNTAPLSPPAQYLWVQTGLGNSGQDMTFWVNP